MQLVEVKHKAGLYVTEKSDLAYFKNRDIVMIGQDAYPYKLLKDLLESIEKIRNE